MLLPLIADGGRILNLSTGLTRFAMPGYAAYAAMKGCGGADPLSGQGAGPRGIAVNVLAPAPSRPTLAVAWCATTRVNAFREPDGPRPGGPA